MRRRFFVDGFDANSATLQGDAAEHLGRVLRAEAGQLYELSDGERVWLAKIEHVAMSRRGGSRIDFALVEPVACRAPRLRVHLLLSIVKFDRFEWALEKATELGVDSVTPLIAARTDKPLETAAQKRMERWSRIVTESAQQSRRIGPPRIEAPMRSEEAFAEARASWKLMMSERRDASSLRELLAHAYTELRQKESERATAALAIGPEGGWTDAEIAAARLAGFAGASLGENILRTETAVAASVAIVCSLFGDL